MATTVQMTKDGDVIAAPSSLVKTFEREGWTTTEKKKKAASAAPTQGAQQ